MQNLYRFMVSHYPWQMIQINKLLQIQVFAWKQQKCIDYSIIFFIHSLLIFRF